ncbi:MAG: hypothetical protein ACRDSF_16565 [Pseudonocardiaceae bacterium]
MTQWLPTDADQDRFAAEGAVRLIRELEATVRPGCDRNAWFPELAMPHRALEPGEQIWSNLMDPVVASQLIGCDQL